MINQPIFSSPLLPLFTLPPIVPEVQLRRLPHASCVSWRLRRQRTNTACPHSSISLPFPGPFLPAFSPSPSLSPFLTSSSLPSLLPLSLPFSCLLVLLLPSFLSPRSLISLLQELPEAIILQAPSQSSLAQPGLSYSTLGVSIMGRALCKRWYRCCRTTEKAKLRLEPGITFPWDHEITKKMQEQGQSREQVAGPVR